MAIAEGLDGPPPKTGEGEGEAVTQKATQPAQQRTHNWPETQWKLVWGIFVFAAVLFAMVFLSLRSRDWTDLQFKAYALTLILTVGLVLVIIGFSDAQIAPLMGIIGALVGYVFGSDRTPKSPSTPGGQPAPPVPGSPPSPAPAGPQTAATLNATT